jgi:sortase A
MKKWLKHTERLLVVVGATLLLFWAAAKLHEIVLSRAAVRQFENLRQPAVNISVGSPLPTLAVPKPSFVSWSEKRIQDYALSLDQHLASPMAVIRINRIHVEAPVLDGTDDLTLNRGVGHIQGTSRPGENGNVGLAGHRDGFFRGLKDIKLGDRIDLEEPDGTETYVVDHLTIVDPHDVRVLQSETKSALTLVTCYPFYYIGSAPRRFIVHATRVDTNTECSPPRG